MNKKHQEFFKKLYDLMNEHKSCFRIRKTNNDMNHDSLEVLIGRREEPYIINDWHDLVDLANGIDEND